MKSDDFYKLINDKDPELTHEFLLMGGLRGLFDIQSDYWSQTNLTRKRRFLNCFRALGLDLDDVYEAGRDALIQFGYGDRSWGIVSEAKKALFEGMPGV